MRGIHFNLYQYTLATSVRSTNTQQLSVNETPRSSGFK